MREPDSDPPRRKSRRPSWLLPALLFFVTCLTTLELGGPAYSAVLMVILLAHEFGHYLQARRYGVPASLPYFIPMPPKISPFGTMGAVILMQPRVATRRALFDLAITGPLAGLIPAIVSSYVGLRMSSFVPRQEDGSVLIGMPTIFRWLVELTLGAPPEGHVVEIHPIAYAGWVGIFITALNLLPISQLDGGHILFTLIPRQAHRVSLGLLILAGLAVAFGGFWQWSPMLGLLILLIKLSGGLRHPPTADRAPLDGARKTLGWLTLLFIVIGFTPKPWIF